jgi:hypothetical protein
MQSCYNGLFSVEFGGGRDCEGWGKGGEGYKEKKGMEKREE